MPHNLFTLWVQLFLASVIACCLGYCVAALQAWLYL